MAAVSDFMLMGLVSRAVLANHSDLVLPVKMSVKMDAREKDLGCNGTCGGLPITLPTSFPVIGINRSVPLPYPPKL